MTRSTGSMSSALRRSTLATMPSAAARCWGRIRVRGREPRPGRTRTSSSSSSRGLSRPLRSGRLSPRELDEDDVRVRPGRGSRPRTRIRPQHLAAADGMAVSVDRGRYGCVVDGVDDGMVVTAMRARELGRRAVVVGDRVSLVGDVTAAAGTLARIVRVATRASVLRRSADDIDPVERVIVANADLLVVVTALADPPPRSRLIDRCLVAAYDGGLTPLLCLTKSDLGDGAALTAAYRPLGVEVMTYTHLRAHETVLDLVCRLLLDK